MALRIYPLLVLAFICAAVFGCRDNPVITYAKKVPIANAGDDKTIESMGEPVMVQLDGSRSRDVDGHIETYRWLSATVAPDGGVGLGGVDPQDVAKPKVMLGEGVWTFALWVVDNDGKWSDPDTVTITVGAPPATANPAVAQCVEAAMGNVSKTCKVCVCVIDDACRTAVKNCDKSCWDLLACVTQNCPNFMQMAAQSPPDYSCLTGNCSAFLAGAQGATAIAPCAQMCQNECTGGGSDAGM